MIVSNSVLMVEKEREKTRGEENVKNNTVAQLKTTLSSKVVTFEFNRGRPAVDMEEKKRVKRNLFRAEDAKGKSSVNRKLSAQLKAKKKLFRSNPVPYQYQGRRLSHHPGRQVEIVESASSWVTSNHRPFQFPEEPSPILFSLEDEEPRRGSAELSRTQFPGLGIVQDVSDDRNPFHDFSPSVPPPFSSAIAHAKWKGFGTGESLTSLEHFCASPQRLDYRCSPPNPQIGEIFHDYSLPSNSSFPDDKLFCSNYSNIEYNSYISSSTNIRTPMINWVLENNDWEDASPVRNMDARNMWEDEGIDADVLVTK